MNKLIHWAKLNSGPLIILFFLCVHLAVIGDYGFTWDFHFHFFGGGKLLGIEPGVMEPRPLPFVEPDPRRAWTLPYGPLMSIPPVASYLLLYKSWHILPPDSAYHLPIILWGIAGIAVLYAFMKEAFSKRVAVIAALLIALTPRYFGDLHNNMKDVPSAVMFTVNMWLLWRLVKHKRPMDLFLALAAFAVAFNVKINSIFIPVVFAVCVFTEWLLNSRRISLRWTQTYRYFVGAPIAAFLLWWVFWPDPIGQLRHAFLTFGVGTNNIEVLLNGNWYCSGSTVPWYYPLWYLGITTPVPVLIFFMIGAVVSFLTVIRTREKTGSARGSTLLLLLVWLFVPLTRYLVPNIGVIDGVRHFEEVLFPIAALAAFGMDTILRFVHDLRIRSAVVSLSILYLLFTNFAYHPYQIAYFNELIGGSKGALGKYDLDYWGTSQKAAVEWINVHAPKGARVHIMMAAAVAGQYLRPDLLPQLNTASPAGSDFVILLNRTSFLYRFFYAYEFYLTRKPVYTVTVGGAPLTWIYDNRTDNVTPRQIPFWKDEDPCIRKYWKGEMP